MTITAIAPAAPAPDPATVQVWLAGHCIANWSGPPAEAPAIAAAWSQRFGILPTVSEGVEW